MHNVGNSLLRVVFTNNNNIITIDILINNYYSM